MQVKVWKRLRKHWHWRIKRRRVHVPVPPSPSPPSSTFPFVDIVRDFQPPSATLPASPRSSCSSDGLRDSATSQRHVSQSDNLTDGDIYSSQSEESTLITSDNMSEKSLSVSSGPGRYVLAGETDSIRSDEQERVAAEESGSPAHGTRESLSSNSSHTSHLPADSLPEEDNHVMVTSESQTAVPENYGDLSMNMSPPEHVEPEVPDADAFLVEDPDDPLSDDEDVRLPPSSVQLSASREFVAPAEEISLAPPSDQRSTALPSPNVNKDVPPPPLDSDDDDDAPEVYLPALILPTMFLPIPNTDPLTTLLTKYINPSQRRPARDLTGDWQRTDFHTLVMTNSWRALAKMARDRVTSTNPEDLPLILSLWYLRLACLSRLRLFNQTSAECTNLFSVLNSIEPASTRSYVFDRLLLFELEVMNARVKYWAGDHMAYLDSLNTLLKKCRTKARLAKLDSTVVSMWKERGSRISLIIASQLMEMKDFVGASKLLEPLCVPKSGITSPALRSAVARIYLQSGHIEMASKHFAAVSADPTAAKPMKDMNAAILASAEGEWVEAGEILAGMLTEDPDNYVAVNNLSVALLSQGKLKEGIEVLETALKSSPSSVVVAEPFLFNLSTLYELHSATAMDKKRELLIEVGKWSGDGLKTACLKMPSN